MSRPTRARGLKLFDVYLTWIRIVRVAPHAGAWIETTKFQRYLRTYSVAPHAGAWIETLS